jgi:hypothetical protein
MLSLRTCRSSGSGLYKGVSWHRSGTGRVRRGGCAYGRTQNDENLQPPRRSYALRFQNPHSQEWLCHTGRGDVDFQVGWCEK